MNQGEVVVTLRVDNGKLTAGLKDSEKQVKSTTEKINSDTGASEKKLSSSFGRIGSIAKTAFKTVATASTVAGAAMVTGFGAAVKSFASLEQNLGGSEVVFGKYSKTIQKLARESVTVMGTSANQYLETANRMGSLFQGAGFSVKKSLDLTSKAMQRATDVATAMGIDTSMALESVAGAAKGNFTMMDNLGVAMNDTTLEAYRLEKGMSKAVSKMTSSEKVGLAMQLFLDRTAKFAGNYARENDTLSGSFQTLKGAWGNFLSGVEGSDTQLLSAGANVARVLSARIPQIAATLGNSLIDLGTKVISSNTTLQNIASTVVRVGTAVGNYLSPKLQNLWTVISTQVIPALTILWKNVIEPLLPVIGTLLVVAIGAVIDIASALLTVISWLVTALKNGNPVVLALAGVFGTLATAMAFTAVFNAMTAGFNTLRLTTIPKTILKVQALRTLISSPIGFGAIAVGAALGALALVQQAADNARSAIDSAMAANTAETNASVNIIQSARRRYDAGEINYSTFRKLVAIGARASGGPVGANQPYLVGENPDGSINSTTELFIPKTSGYIMNSSDLQASLFSNGKNSSDRSAPKQIIQNNTINTPLDMNVVNRSLAREINR